MSANRSRGEVKTYRRYIKKLSGNVCEFCNIANTPNQVVASTDSFYVIKNLFPYSLWDNQSVADHLMIIPKRHVDSLAAFSPQEASEFLKLLSEYESQGYNVYARAPGSKIKTVVHQHTHLIKPKGKMRKFIIFARKPYIRFVA